MADVALVLLSGGLDSTAALHWALDQPMPVHALGFDYGQPNRASELDAARGVALRRNVPFSVIELPGLQRLDPTAGLSTKGVARAFVPGRNALFLACAAARLANIGGDGLLVVGANKNDAAGFPDCRMTFFQMQEQALAAAFNGLCSLWIATPWLFKTKAEIVTWCVERPEALSDVRRSVSCYRGTRCGDCDPCMLRAAAFAANRIEDSIP